MTTGISQAEERLLSAISAGHVPHACFISCPDLLMAEAMAKKAAMLYCRGIADGSGAASCPDCVIPADLKKEAIQAMTEDINRSSFSGGKRAVLLLNIHTMAEGIQNKLLKTIEEPPENILFILTGSRSGILPTILSRCAVLLCSMPTGDEVARELIALGSSQPEAESYAAQGVTLDRALRLYNDPEFRALRQNAQSVLIELLSGRLPFEKQQAIASADGAHFMLSFMRDMLNYKVRGILFENQDRAKDIQAIIPRFTTGKISCIIEILAQAMERLNTNASPNGTFTRLFSEIAEEL